MPICSLESGKIGATVLNHVAEKEPDSVPENVLFYPGKSQKGPLVVVLINQNWLLQNQHQSKRKSVRSSIESKLVLPLVVPVSVKIRQSKRMLITMLNRTNTVVKFLMKNT